MPHLFLGLGLLSLLARLVVFVVACTVFLQHPFFLWYSVDPSTSCFWESVVRCFSNLRPNMTVTIGVSVSHIKYALTVYSHQCHWPVCNHFLLFVVGFCFSLYCTVCVYWFRYVPGIREEHPNVVVHPHRMGRQGGATHAARQNSQLPSKCRAHHEC